MTMNLKIGKEKKFLNYSRKFKIKSKSLFGNIIILGNNSSLLLSDILKENKRILNIDLVGNKGRGFKSVKDILNTFKSINFEMKDISSLSINTNLKESECQDIVELRNILNSKGINLILSDDNFLKIEKYKDFVFDMLRGESQPLKNKSKNEKILDLSYLNRKMVLLKECFEYYLVTKASHGEYLVYLETYSNAFKDISEKEKEIKKDKLSIKPKSRINLKSYENLEDNDFLLIKKPNNNLYYDEKKLFFNIPV